MQQKLIRVFVHPAEADELAEALEDAGATDVRMRHVVPLNTGIDPSLTDLSCCAPTAIYPPRAEVTVQSSGADVPRLVELIRRRLGGDVRVTVRDLR